MNNLNSILIEGNLVRDPQLKSTSKGTQICTMKLASNRYYKLDSHAEGFEKEVSYFDVETWARLAEACYAKGRKGRGMRVVGRLKQSRWNDPEGKLRTKVTIVAEHVEFRPESKKEAKPAMEISFDEEDIGDENSEPVMTITGKELDRVVF